MNISKIFLSSKEYFIINKNLLKKFGIEAVLILSELIRAEEYQQNEVNEIDYTFNNLSVISDNTTLPKSKIKEGINKLYKLKFIDVIVKKPEKLYVKILHQNISNEILKNQKTGNEKQKTQKKEKLIKTTKFKKPNIQNLKEYFLKLSVKDESEEMFDFYESKGWKIGKNSMKCWKSAARNWARRTKKEKDNFPNYYDQKFEKEIITDSKKIFEYHQHLKNLGFHPSYSPTAGTTWKLKKQNK